MHEHEALIEVLLNALRREYERIERTQAEIIHLKEELIDAGYVFQADPEETKLDS